ncbi:MAG: hypothetical protein ABI418_04665, partial [Jatrophihabitantaceae bacterium]
ATDFAEGLLAAWINDALNQVRTDANNIATPGLAVAFDNLHQAVRRQDPDRVLSWMRRSSHRPVPGLGVAHGHNTGEALLALAKVTSTDTYDGLPARGPSNSASGPVDVLIAGAHTSGVELANEAFDRVAKYRQDGDLGPSDSIVIICAGAMGPLQATANSTLPVDIIDDACDDIIVGGSVLLVSTSEVLVA